MKCANAKIPITLLRQTITVLENLYLYDATLNLAPDFISFFESVLWDLQQKAQSLDLRDAYSKMVAATSDDARLVTRIDYLRLKNVIDSYKLNPPF